MLRVGVVAGLLLGIAACAPTAQDRARDYNEMGLSLFGRGSYTPARACFETALNLQPDNSNLIYNIGQCYDRQGQTAMAEETYQRCLKRAPNHAECRHALARLMVRQGRRADARRMVEGWLTTEPRLAAAYAEDGYLWLEEKNFDNAQGRIQQALDLDPTDPRALTEWGRYCEAMRRPEQALAVYERVIEADPSRADLVQRVRELRARKVGRPHPD